MFFQGSVTGLNVGSPVNFRGVRVGQVTNVYIRYQPDGTPSMEIPVLADFSGNNVQIVRHLRRDERKSGRPGRSSCGSWSIRGCVRNWPCPVWSPGQATISLDFFPDTPAEFCNTYPDRVEIPTVPSTLQEVQATLQQIYEKISQLPLDDLVERRARCAEGSEPAGQRSGSCRRPSPTQARRWPIFSRWRARSTIACPPLVASIDATSGTANRAMIRPLRRRSPASKPAQNKRSATPTPCCKRRRPP